MKPLNKKQLEQLHFHLIKAWELQDGDLSERVTLTIMDHHDVPEDLLEDICELYNRRKEPSIGKLEGVLYSDIAE